MQERYLDERMRALEARVFPNRTKAMEAFAVGSGGKVERFPGVTCVCTPIPFDEFNSAYISDGASVENEALERVKGFFRNLQSDWMIVFPPTLAEVSWNLPLHVAVTRWFRFAELVLPRDSASLKDTPPELDIRKVSSVDELMSWARTATAGYEMDDQLTKKFLDHFASPQNLAVEGLSYYVGRCSGKPAAVSASYVSDAVVGAYAVATVPEFRGKGFGTAMTAYAVKDGFSKGCDLAELQPSQLGAPVYFRMGFRHVFDYYCWGISPRIPRASKSY